MANDALHANPTHAGIAEHITIRGSDWLWAAFAIMLFTDLVVLCWHFTIPRGQRIFHQLALIILTTASIAYFSMASNLGYVGIDTEFAHMGFAKGVERQIWYVRYIDWTITTPALLLTLVLSSGLPLSDITTLIFFNLVMIVTGLVGALVKSAYKWGYYAFGNVALFYIWWVLIGPARTSAGALGPKYKSTFTKSAALLSFLWLGYPIAWGLCDGGNYISPDSEMIFYGILDVMAKPVYTLFHLWGLSKLDLTALQLSSGKFSETAERDHHHDVEKAPRFNNQAPAAAGNNNVIIHDNEQPATAKKGMFAKKGKYDATPAAPVGTTNAAVAPESRENSGRVSNATAVSQ